MFDGSAAIPYDDQNGIVMQTHKNNTKSKKRLLGTGKVRGGRWELEVLQKFDPHPALRATLSHWERVARSAG
jgi:hypothetical protein